MKSNRITIRAFVLGTFFSAVFAVLTVYATNVPRIYLTATQIPVLPYLLLIVMILLLNPLCRLIRVIRAFSTVELLIIFLMGMVSSGVSSFGLTDQLVPIAGSLFNREWNNKQSKWNMYVVPFVNNEYFLSIPGRGIQEAADEYHESEVSLLKLKSSYDMARPYKIALDDVVEAEAELKEMEKGKVEKSAGKEKKGMKLSLARIAVENARGAKEEAEQDWERVRESRGLGGLEGVLQSYPGLIEEGEKRVADAENYLTDLEQEAFERVELFRRGLPEGMNAYPGIFPMPVDDMSSYFGRMRRLARGITAMKALKQGLDEMRPFGGSEVLEGDLRARFEEVLDSATDSLAPLSETAGLEEQKERLREEEALLTEHSVKLTERLKQESEARRKAKRGEALALGSQIKETERVLKKQEKLAKKLKLAQERNERELICARKVRDMCNGIEGLKRDMGAGVLTVSGFRRRVEGMLPAFAGMDMSLRRYFIGEVPWSHWLRPLARWAMVIGLTYIILMSFNVLIFRQWAHNEKLTYPLAELPKALVGGTEGGGGISGIFRNGLFWAGVAVSGTVLGWNLLCWTNLVPGLRPFLLNYGTRWDQYVVNTQFHALGLTRSAIFFTMIGLSFLVPKNISFSLWFFHVLSMIQLLLMVWAGHGQDERSFPTDWWYLLNFRSAQGQGALIVFAGVVFYKCRKYIFCAFAPSTVSSLDQDEQKELKLASLTFVLCSIGLVLVLWRDMGANLYYAIFVYFLILVITIGLIRAVTEGGLLAFQACSPFHFIRAFFGFNRTWTSASLFAPLMVFYSIIFLDIKTFIAPAMANALKLRDDFRMKRGVFHMAIFTGIVVAAVAAIATALMIAYAHGADAMNSWFYTSLPRSHLFGTICTAVNDAPEASFSGAVWISIGAVVMAALLYFRQFVFWLPHPIGMIMLVNPIMRAYWFSILLGWLCNVAVTKYGNKNTYHRATGFFIGLIVGELLIVILATFISMATGRNIQIDLNR